MAITNTTQDVPFVENSPYSTSRNCTYGKHTEQPEDHGACAGQPEQRDAQPAQCGNLLLVAQSLTANHNLRVVLLEVHDGRSASNGHSDRDQEQRAGQPGGARDEVL